MGNQAATQTDQGRPTGAPSTEDIGPLRRFYRAHLAQYLAFRVAKQAVLGAYFPVRNWFIALSQTDLHGFRFDEATENIVKWLKRKKYRLVPLGRYSAFNPQVRSRVIEQDISLTVPPPVFVSPPPCQDISSDGWKILSPKLVISEIRNGTVMGGSNFVFAGKSAIHPDLYFPAKEVCPAEMHGAIRLDVEAREITFPTTRKPPVTDKAITMLGQCAGNYAHWLTEILPRLVVLNTHKRYDGIPLLVDDDIHPNLYDSLETFNKGRRAIIKVPRWKTHRASRLIDLSTVGYIRANDREIGLTGRITPPQGDEFAFSVPALVALRDAGWQTLPEADRKVVGTRKLYVRRANTANSRLALNENAMERLAIQSGFEVVEPGGLSFREQIALFSSAKVIIGQAGAALANVIFAPPGCKIVIVAASFEGGNYYFWPSIFSILGHESCYVLGKQIGEGHPIHRNFAIDIDDFAVAINRFT